MRGRLAVEVLPEKTMAASALCLRRGQAGVLPFERDPTGNQPHQAAPDQRDEDPFADAAQEIAEKEAFDIAPIIGICTVGDVHLLPGWLPNQDQFHAHE